MRTSFAVLLIVISIIATLVFAAPYMQGAVPDPLWVVLYQPIDDPIADRLVSQLNLAQAYDISTTSESEFEGKNLIIVGGPAIAAYAPWINPLVLTKPVGWQGAIFETSDQGATWKIRTPQYLYPWEMVEGKDLGFIDRAYYTARRQWVIMINGFSLGSTAVISQVLIDMPDAMARYNYLVIEHLNPLSVTDSIPEDFSWSDYNIIEYG